MKICIFPNDPIIKYYEKGELKKKYFNPENIFDEIDIISFVENDVSEEKVQILAGTAKLKIHSVGNVNLKNRKKKIPKILAKLQTIRPDIIRSYSPLLPGWFATKCAEELNIPSIVSIHTQMEYSKKIMQKNSLKKFFVLKFTEKFIEPFVLQSASKIMIIHEIIKPYVMQYSDNEPEVIYNRIDTEQFSTGKIIEELPKPIIISVGRLIEPKNHQCLIEAMKEINGYLLIIGDGPLYNKLMTFVKELGLEKKVIIKKSVPNNRIQDYYQSAKIFALPYDTELEGIPIPVMEAMAAGLPIVISRSSNEQIEGLGNSVCYSNRTPSAFAENINQILNNNNLAEKFSKMSKKSAKKFDFKDIEEREAQIYLELLKKSKIGKTENNNS